MLQLLNLFLLSNLALSWGSWKGNSKFRWDQCATASYAKAVLGEDSCKTSAVLFINEHNSPIWNYNQSSPSGWLSVSIVKQMAKAPIFSEPMAIIAFRWKIPAAQNPKPPGSIFNCFLDVPWILDMKLHSEPACSEAELSPQKVRWSALLRMLGIAQFSRFNTFVMPLKF